MTDRTKPDGWDNDIGECHSVFIDQELLQPLSDYHPRIGKNYSVIATRVPGTDFITLMALGRDQNPTNPGGLWHPVAQSILGKLRLEVITANAVPHLYDDKINEPVAEDWSLVAWRVDFVEMDIGRGYEEVFLDTLSWRHRGGKTAKSGWTWTQT